MAASPRGLAGGGVGMRNSDKRLAAQLVPAVAAVLAILLVGWGWLTVRHFVPAKAVDWERLYETRVLPAGCEAAVRFLTGIEPMIVDPGTMLPRLATLEAVHCAGHPALADPSTRGLSDLALYASPDLRVGAAGRTVPGAGYNPVATFIDLFGRASETGPIGRAGDAFLKTVCVGPYTNLYQTGGKRMLSGEIRGLAARILDDDTLRDHGYEGRKAACARRLERLAEQAAARDGPGAIARGLDYLDLADTLGDEDAFLTATLWYMPDQKLDRMIPESACPSVRAYYRTFGPAAVLVILHDQARAKRGELAPPLAELHATGRYLPTSPERAGLWARRAMTSRDDGRNPDPTYRALYGALAEDVRTRIDADLAASPHAGMPCIALVPPRPRCALDAEAANLGMTVLDAYLATAVTLTAQMETDGYACPLRLPAGG